MGKKGNGSAQRAKRKHEKEQKRKKALAHMRRAQEARVSDRMPWPDGGSVHLWVPEVDGIAAFAARTGRHFYQVAFEAEGLLPRGDAQRGLRFWTPGQVAAMSTETLVENLRTLGIPVDRDELLAETAGFGSAVAHAREAWLPRGSVVIDVHAQDFVCLAACELWRRWRPDPPSMEMLLEALLLGYDPTGRDSDLAATERWIRFWWLLRPLLTSEVRTTKAADALFGGRTPPLRWWAFDFSDAATHAARLDRDAGRRAAEVLGEILSQFGEEDERWQIALAADRGEILYETGERAEGETILRELIAKHPTRPAAYIRLAQLWAPAGCIDREPLARALALLELAAAQPVEHADDWELQDRIDELRDTLREAPSTDAPTGTRCHPPPAGG